MPVYEYRCENGHEFEVLQRMSDSSLTECRVCEAPVQRVFHAPAIHFKGSGFYNTDYGRKRGGSSETDSSNGSGEGKSEKKADGASKSGDGAGSSGSSESKTSSSDSKSSSAKAPEAA